MLQEAPDEHAGSGYADQPETSLPIDVCSAILGHLRHAEDLQAAARCSKTLLWSALRRENLHLELPLPDSGPRGPLPDFLWWPVTRGPATQKGNLHLTLAGKAQQLAPLTVEQQAEERQRLAASFKLPLLTAEPDGTLSNLHASHLALLPSNEVQHTPEPNSTEDQCLLLQHLDCVPHGMVSTLVGRLTLTRGCGVSLEGLGPLLSALPRVTRLELLDPDMLGDPSVLRLLPVLSELTINVSAYGASEHGLVTMETLRLRELALAQMDPSERERLQGGAQFLRLREALLACPGLERLELRSPSGGAACLFRGGLPWRLKHLAVVNPYDDLPALMSALAGATGIETLQLRGVSLTDDRDAELFSQFLVANAATLTGLELRGCLIEGAGWEAALGFLGLLSSLERFVWTMNRAKFNIDLLAPSIGYMVGLKELLLEEWYAGYSKQVCVQHACTIYVLCFVLAFFKLNNYVIHVPGALSESGGPAITAPPRAE